MGFTSDEDGNDDGRIPPLTATIVDIGVDYRDYSDGNDESRLVVLWKPDNDVFGVQTVILSNSHVLKVVSDAKTIRVGGAERGFDIEIIGHVIQSGRLGYKAALWMAKLKELGVKTPGDSGNLEELLGVKAVLKQLTYSEAKGRPKKDSEKVFWLPVEILSVPGGTENDEEATALPEEPTLVAAPVAGPILEEDILRNVEGLSESELVKWYEGSCHFDGKSVVPLFMAVTKAVEEGLIKEADGKYQVGIREPIGDTATHTVDVTGALEEEASSPSNNNEGVK